MDVPCDGCGLNETPASAFRVGDRYLVTLCPRCLDHAGGDGAAMAIITPPGRWTWVVSAEQIDPD